MINIKSNGKELLLGEKAFSDDYKKSEKLFPKNDRKIVAVFGGAFVKENSEDFNKTVEFAKLIGSRGYDVISGGGGGIMEAANKGAAEAGTGSYGLMVELIPIEHKNRYIDSDKFETYDTLYVRLLTLISVADAVVLFPGGYGTMEEFFSLVVRLRTNINNAVPIYLMNSSYWTGLIEWMKTNMLQNGYIDAKDLEYFSVEDDIMHVADDISKKFS